MGVVKIAKPETDVPGTQTLTRLHREIESCCQNYAPPLTPAMYYSIMGFDPRRSTISYYHLDYPALCTHCASRRLTMSGCLSHTKYALWLDIQSFLSSARLMSNAYNRREIMRRISA